MGIILTTPLNINGTAQLLPGECTQLLQTTNNPLKTYWVCVYWCDITFQYRNSSDVLNLWYYPFALQWACRIEGHPDRWDDSVGSTGFWLLGNRQVIPSLVISDIWKVFWIEHLTGLLWRNVYFGIAYTSKYLMLGSRALQLEFSLRVSLFEDRIFLIYSDYFSSLLQSSLFCCSALSFFQYDLPKVSSVTSWVVLTMISIDLLLSILKQNMISFEQSDLFSSFGFFLINPVWFHLKKLFQYNRYYLGIPSLLLLFSYCCILIIPYIITFILRISLLSYGFVGFCLLEIFWECQSFF